MQHNIVYTFCQTYSQNSHLRSQDCVQIISRCFLVKFYSFAVKPLPICDYALTKGVIFVSDLEMGGGVSYIAPVQSNAQHLRKSSPGCPYHHCHLVLIIQRCSNDSNISLIMNDSILRALRSVLLLV